MYGIDNSKKKGMCVVELTRIGILDYMCAVELLFCVCMCEV